MPLRPLSAALFLVFFAVRARAGAGVFGDIPMGRCVGDAPAVPPPTDGEPVDFRKVPQGDATVKTLALLGYKTDPDSGTAQDAAGRPVTAATLQWLAAPVDFSQERVSSALWNALMQQGYRLDEATCRLAKPGAEPLPRFAYEQMQRGTDDSVYRREALEVLGAELAGLSPDAPIPASVRARMAELEGLGAKLPDALRAKLSAAGSTVGSVSGDLQADYIAQTRAFDGQASEAALKAAAQPADWSPGAPSAQSTEPLLPAEQRLGLVLERSAIENLSRNASGRELLSRFTAKDGSVHLPTTLILKTNQRPDENGQYGAYYSSGQNLMVINHWQVEYSLLAGLTPAERARVGPGLADTAALQKYLEDHPDRRAQMFGSIDFLFFHELVHAWQDRRDRLDVEILRGNVPGYSPIAKEHEAFREECRYMFDKAKAEPDSLMLSGHARPFCFPLLKSYDGFEDVITRMYSGTFAGTLPMETIAQIQKERESAARVLADSLYQSAVEKLKLAGFWHGDEALSAAQSDYAARAQSFRTTVLPALVAQAVGPLPTKYEEEKHLDWAQDLLDAVDPAAPGRAGAAARWIAAAFPGWKKQASAENLEGQLLALNFAMNLAYAKVVPLNPDIKSLYLRDVRAYVAAKLQNAAHSVQADEELKTARNWASVLPEDDPVRARAEAAAPGAPR